MKAPRRVRGGLPTRVGGHLLKKRLGQHFLTDDAVIAAIADAIAPDARPIHEIGPGMGALSLPLLARGARLTLIELDRDLVQHWHGQQAQHPELAVIEGDVLKVDFGQLAAAQPTPLRVVGNLPYNISSPILFHLLAHAARVADQHFMLQKEVIDRMVGKPCTSAYGRMSVVLQWRYDMTALFDVPPLAFEPPPRVVSSVVRMVPRPVEQLGVVKSATLEALVQAAFSQRRKLMRHSLGPWLEARHFSGAFDLQRRAEEVSVAEYVALAQQL